MSVRLQMGQDEYLPIPLARAVCIQLLQKTWPQTVVVKLLLPVNMISWNGSKQTGHMKDLKSSPVLPVLPTAVASRVLSNATNPSFNSVVSLRVVILAELGGLMGRDPFTFLRVPSSTIILAGVGGLRFCICLRREDTTFVVIGTLAGLTGEVVSLGSNLDGVDCLVGLVTLGTLSTLGDSSNNTGESLLLTRDGLECLASCKNLLKVRSWTACCLRRYVLLVRGLAPRELPSSAGLTPTVATLPTVFLLL